MRLTKDCINTILEECKASLVKTKVSDADAEEFLDLASGLLQDYQDRLGEDADIEYRNHLLEQLEAAYVMDAVDREKLARL
ncbi:MAG: hypothetical protein Q4C09_09785 [Atopobiaceae bacterium]|nr:hypothetical protein [Atopobiaceae bacterium]